MSFWKSGPKAPPSEPAPITTPTDPSEKPLPIITEKPLPDPTLTLVSLPQQQQQPSPPPLGRPGTSGTELALASTRRAASQTFQAARRAERSYKACKRAAAARTAYASARTHFGAAAHHFAVGFGLAVEAARAVPYVVEDGMAHRRAAAAERRALEAGELKEEEEEKEKENHEGPIAGAEANDEAGEVGVGDATGDERSTRPPEVHSEGEGEVLK